MKICFLAAANSIHSLKWIRYFADLGHEVHWITLKPSIFDIPANIHLYHAKNILHGIFMAKRVVRTHKVDLVHAHYAGSYGLIGSFFTEVPFLLTAWGSDILLDHSNIFKQILIKKILLKRILSRAKLITVDAEHMTNALINLGVPHEKIKRINFGIDVEQTKPLDAPKSNEFRVSSIRNLEPIYNVITFVEAIPHILKQVPQAVFTIGGSGSEEAFLKTRVRELGLGPKVHFTGSLKHNEVMELLHKTTVYVSTSLSDAGIAASTAEAMACGIPVVITNSGENAQWVQAGHNGFLVPIKSPRELADKVIRVLKDDDLRAKFSKTGRDIIVENNSYQNEMNKMNTIYLSYGNQ